MISLTIPAHPQHPSPLSVFPSFFLSFFLSFILSPFSSKKKTNETTTTGTKIPSIRENNDDNKKEKKKNIQLIFCFLSALGFISFLFPSLPLDFSSVFV